LNVYFYVYTLKTEYYRARNTLVRCSLTATSIAKINIMILCTFRFDWGCWRLYLRIQTSKKRIEINDYF